MSSINDKGDIYSQAHEFISNTRGTILYTEKIKEFKDYLVNLGVDEWIETQIMIYDFDDGEFVYGAQSAVIVPDHSFIIFAYGVKRPDNGEIEVNNKSYW